MPHCLWKRLTTIGVELIRFLSLRRTSRLHQLAYIGDLAEQRMAALGIRDTTAEQPTAREARS